MNQLFDDATVLQIDQHAHSWYEVLFNFEQRNQYAISAGGRHRGFAVEQGTTLVDRIKRVLMGSRRPLEIIVFTGNDEPALKLTRPFYWIFSTMTVSDGNGRAIGTVAKRWGLVTKKYELFDGQRSFANISSGIFKVWTFPVFGINGQQIATISKKWGGLLKEYLTDADKFGVKFESPNLTTTQKAVIFAAALSIDFDYFENNQNQ